MLFEERRARTTELCLFSAARCELVEKVIMPAIKAGQDVILDRYWWSTVVYQGEKLWPDDPHKAVLSIQSLADSLRWPPAFTVLVSTPPEVIMHRMKTKKSQEQTVFDPATVSTVYSQIKLYDLCYRATPSDRTLQVSGEDEALSISVELIIKELKNRFP
jgi:dTMP kinase